MARLQILMGRLQNRLHCHQLFLSASRKRENGHRMIGSGPQAAYASSCARDHDCRKDVYAHSVSNFDLSPSKRPRLPMFHAEMRVLYGPKIVDGKLVSFKERGGARKR